MPDEPTLGEVLRRVEDLVRTVATIAERLDRANADNASTYVRKDVYDEGRRADQATIKALRNEVETADAKAARSRTFALGAIVGLATTIVSVVTFALQLGGAA